jgi:hypothetical protein
VADVNMDLTENFRKLLLKHNQSGNSKRNKWLLFWS